MITYEGDYCLIRLEKKGGRVRENFPSLCCLSDYIPMLLKCLFDSKSQRFYGGSDECRVRDAGYDGAAGGEMDVYGGNAGNGVDGALGVRLAVVAHHAADDDVERWNRL